MELKETDMMHGFVNLSNGKIITLFYFEKTLVGMATVPILRGNSDYFRLRGVMFHSDKAIIPNEKNVTQH